MRDFEGEGVQPQTAHEALERRQAITAGQSECPVGRWVSLDEFSQYMRAAGHDFLVTSDTWTLYIAEAQYGSLGWWWQAGRDEAPFHRALRKLGFVLRPSE